MRSHGQIARGIELQISPEEAGISPEQARVVIRALVEAAQQALEQYADKEDRK